MDLSEPGRGLAGGLTMPILRALADRSSPVTAAQLTRVAQAGTEAGVRRAVERLAAHGVCLAEEVGGRVVYTLNYDHLLYDTVRTLLRADSALPRRLKQGLAGWEPAAASAVLFGSAARGDGDTDSDIDLLLIRPAVLRETGRRDWARQVHELRAAVQRWTGNRLQVLDWTPTVLRRHARAGEPLIDAILDDGVTVAGADLTVLLQRSA